MENCVTVKKIKLNEEIYFLRVFWADCLELMIFNGDQFWSGTLTGDKIDYFCNHLKINREQYFENAKRALTDNDTTDGFVIKFSDNLFTWEKCIESSALRLKHGIVEMEHKENGGYEFLIDDLLRMIKEKENKLECKDQELNCIAIQLKCLVEKFESSADLKNKMEQDLYSRFVVLLNEKKQKISEYEEFIKHLETKGLIRKTKIPAIKDKQDICISDSD